MTPQKTFLVFGATGQTGRHFVDIALREGHRVRALVRDPAKLPPDRPGLEVHPGAVAEVSAWAGLVEGADAVVVMLGDAAAQRHARINTAFVQALIPVMRRHHVTAFLYQAGGLSAAPGERLPLLLRAVRRTVARRYLGQHRDNEAVMRYLADEAGDIDWTVHRAAIGSAVGSKGVLERSERRPGIATFQDCAAYNYRTLLDSTAVHTCSLSRYRKGAVGPGAGVPRP